MRLASSIRHCKSDVFYINNACHHARSVWVAVGYMVAVGYKAYQHTQGKKQCPNFCVLEMGPGIPLRQECLAPVRSEVTTEGGSSKIKTTISASHASKHHAVTFCSPAVCIPAGGIIRN